MQCVRFERHCIRLTRLTRGKFLGSRLNIFREKSAARIGRALSGRRFSRAMVMSPCRSRCRALAASGLASTARNCRAARTTTTGLQLREHMIAARSYRGRWHRTSPAQLGPRWLRPPTRRLGSVLFIGNAAPRPAPACIPRGLQLRWRHIFHYPASRCHRQHETRDSPTFFLSPTVAPHLGTRSFNAGSGP